MSSNLTDLKDRGRACCDARLVRLLSVSVLLLLGGCGGGSAPPNPPALTSVQISPANPSIVAGSTQQFSATATYSDSSTKDVTSSSSWTTSNSSSATIQTMGQSNPGLATGVAAGSATITAAFGGMNSSTTLTMTAKAATLTSVQISPLNATIAAGTTQQFFASATYSDNSTKDVTSSSTWTTSDTNATAIQTMGQPNPGLATGAAAGSATITATFSSVSSSTTLTITSAAGNGDKIPLMDMTPAQNYLTFLGGLYENVSDTPPADHNTAGLAAASAIQQLDMNGNPSASGKVVFVSIGRSAEQDEFNVFVQQAGASSTVNHTTLVIANGALTGVLPCAWTVAVGPPPCDPALGNQYDRVRDTVLAPLGVTEQQVQAAWVEEYNADPASGGFQTLCDPTVAGCSNTASHSEALRYEQQLGAILRAAKTRWPNLHQAFQSSRIFAGYAATDHNEEPYAYEYGFSVKWLIEAQICQQRAASSTNCPTAGQVDPVAGDLNYQTGVTPWTAWAAYLWADGAVPRSDALVWCNGQAGAPCNAEIDYLTDGTHPNPTGQQKAASLLLNYFLNSPYTAWFRP